MIGKVIDEARRYFPGDPVVAAILPAAFLLRIHNLSGHSIWFDEAFSIKFAELHLNQLWSLGDNSPPLYYIFLHWWTGFAGTSAFSARLPSAIFGTVSVFMAYKVGFELFGRNAGRAAAFLTAVSVFQIEYSQEARVYSLFALLTLLSMHYFLKIQRNASAGNLAGYVLFSILLLYSHVYGIFVIIAQNAYFAALCFLSGKSSRCGTGKWISVQFTLAALFVPWLPVFMSRVREVAQKFWIARPDHNTLMDSFSIFASQSPLLLLILLALSALAAVSIENGRGRVDGGSFFRSVERMQWKIRPANTESVCFLLLWLTIPIAIPFVISLVSRPIYLTRYAIAASVAFFLLAAAGLSRLRGFFKWTAFVLIAALSLFKLDGYYSDTGREQWKDVAQHIDAHSRRGDLLIFKSPAGILPYDFYSRSDVPARKGVSAGASRPAGNRPQHVTLDDIVMNQYRTGSNVGEIILEEADPDMLLESCRKYDRIWLVLSHTVDCPSVEGGEPIEAVLAKRFRLLLYKEYRGVKVYLFDTRPSLGAGRETLLGSAGGKTPGPAPRVF